MGFDAILFDLDGTLTESGPGLMRSAGWALEQLGIPAEDPAELRRVVGPPLHESFSRWFNVPPEELDEAVRLFRVCYREMGGIYESDPYPGITDLLTELKGRGKRLLVATSKPQTMADQVMDHWKLTPYFEAVYGGPLEESGCKKSLVVRMALDHLGADYQGKVLMVGDREQDVFGAHENGIPCAGVLWGYGSQEEFDASGADYLVKDGAELLELIGNAEF